MPRGRQADPKGSEENGSGQAPKSLQIADEGINTSKDFRNLMSAIMSDVIAGRISASTTNAACNAGGKMLKMVDLEYKYATNPDRPNRVLDVAFEDRIETAETKQIAGE